jgi:hypothetical protein
VAGGISAATDPVNISNGTISLNTIHSGNVTNTIDPNKTYSITIDQYGRITSLQESNMDG